MIMVVKSAWPLFELARKCQNFRFPQLFSKVFYSLFEELFFDIHDQVQVKDLGFIFIKS